MKELYFAAALREGQTVLLSVAPGGAILVGATATEVLRHPALHESADMHIYRRNGIFGQLVLPNRCQAPGQPAPMMVRLGVAQQRALLNGRPESGCACTSCRPDCPACAPPIP